MVNYNQQVGSQFNDALTVPDRTVAYGLGGEDILSTSTGVSVLVGGLGGDSYIVTNNATAIILDDGNSAGDVVVATGIGFYSSKTVMLEIDSRHFVAYNTDSGQTLIIIDWQIAAANIIESVQFSEGAFSHQFIASNFRNTVGYYGNYTVEQADAQLLGGKLAANGITSSSVEPLILHARGMNAYCTVYPCVSGLVGNFLNKAGADRLSKNGNATYIASNTDNDALIERPGNDTLTSGLSMTHSLAMVEPIALPSVLQINLLSPLPILSLLILLRFLLLVLKLG